MRIAIENFGGLSPRTDAAMLPPNGAQIARDVRLHSGALRGWRKPLSFNPIVTIPSNIKTMFYDEGAPAAYVWTTHVNMVFGPVADESDNKRYYFTGDGTPKKTDSALGLAGALEMGVPAPLTAPTLSNDGVGTGTAEDHVYVVTYVSTFSGISEEGPPSPPVTASAWQPGDTVTLTWTDTVPTTGYNITARRIYRSNGGDYLFVKEQSVTGAPTTETDALLNAALGESLSTLTFEPPPAGLTGLVSLANGILAGFVGNQIYFSEPYQPHAWPSGYAQATNEIIVAVVPAGQGAYVLTEGHPYICSGLTPDSMTLERLTKYAPCVSARSAVSDGKGAIYASYNGVAYIRGGEVINQTEGLMTQEEWSYFEPTTMFGVYYDERYIVWVNIPPVDLTALGTDYVLSQSLMAANVKALVFDTTVPNAPMTVMHTYTDTAYIRPSTGRLYIIDNGEIKQFDGDEVNRTIYEWRSKVFQLPYPTNFGALQVYADHGELSWSVAEQIAANANAAAYNAAAQAANAAAQATNAALFTSLESGGGWGSAGINQYSWNGSNMENLLTEQQLASIGSIDGTSLNVKVYADSKLKFTGNITSNDPITLPAGFKSDRWEISISSNKTVRRVVMASTIKELRGA